MPDISKVPDMGHFPILTLARQASHFEYILANANLHSPWRYGDAYVHPWGDIIITHNGVTS